MRSGYPGNPRREESGPAFGFLIPGCPTMVEGILARWYDTFVLTSR